ncbi:MAG: TIGR02996 domain-containing protein [Proteobacteria bacterium]|nr:TIGR02996 domain-containing protein [Pseudomonadota bacterium]
MTARNLDLEAQILKLPDDDALYAVYADWLAERGDPRGELISLSLAPMLADVMGRLTELHQAHDAAWVGALPAHVSLTWRRGFVDAIKFGDDDHAEIDVPVAYAAMRDRLLDGAAFGLLRSLTLGAFEDESNYMPDYSKAIAAMTQHGVPPWLRELRIDRGGYWDISSTEGADLADLYPLLPNLETLYLAVGRMELGAIDLPALRDLEVYTGGFSGENCASVIAANCPNLERLILRFGSSQDYGGTSTADDIRPLLASTRFGKVKHLALANAPFTNELLPDLVRSPLLSQLETLDLSWGFLDDTGVATILANVDAFRHLRTLDVTDSYIATRAADLKAALPQTIGTDDQKAVEQNDDWRYCHVGE